MGIQLEIDFTELSRIVEQTKGIKVRAEDIREASQEIRLIIQEDIDFRFQNAPNTETGGQVYGGVQWRSLSESYLANNLRRYGGQILRDTGELQQSLTSEGHPYNIYEVSNSDLVFGSALAKARRLQKDRPFIFWHERLVEKVTDFIAAYLGGE